MSVIHTGCTESPVTRRRVLQLSAASLAGVLLSLSEASGEEASGGTFGRPNELRQVVRWVRDERNPILPPDKSSGFDSTRWKSTLGMDIY